MMGALFDGYEAARQKQEAAIAERRRREAVVDQHLGNLSALLDEDKTFMDGHGLAHDISHHALRVLRNQTPVITVHYELDAEKFRAANMSDGANVSTATAEESAAAIGEMIFRMLAPKA